MTRSAPEPTVAATRVARVVVDGAPAHLAEPLDYLIPAGTDGHAGSRVEVPFAGRRSRGLVVALSDTSDLDPARLRPLHRPLGGFAWVRADELDVLRWAADRFAAPLADVVRHALPDRVVDVERGAARAGWLPPDGPAVEPAPRPAGPAPTTPAGWAAYGAEGVAVHAAAHAGGGTRLWRPLPGEDVAARLAALVAACLAGGRAALVVVPAPASPPATSPGPAEPSPKASSLRASARPFTPSLAKTAAAAALTTPLSRGSTAGPSLRPPLRGRGATARRVFR
ncbi:MAG: hypothetical protein ACO4BW_02840 [Nitriliruptoraceae bacterium]